MAYGTFYKRTLPDHTRAGGPAAPPGLAGVFVQLVLAAPSPGCGRPPTILLRIQDGHHPLPRCPVV